MPSRVPGGSDLGSRQSTRRGSRGSVCLRGPRRWCRLRARRLLGVSHNTAYTDSLRTNWQWVVVVSCECGLSFHGVGARRGVVLCGIWGSCRVEGARSRLQSGAICGSWSISLDSAWSHVCDSTEAAVTSGGVGAETVVVKNFFVGFIQARDTWAVREPWYLRASARL